MRHDSSVALLGLSSSPGATVLAAWLVVAGAGSGCVRGVDARAESWWSARTAHVRLETDMGSDRARSLALRVERQVQTIRGAFYRCALDDTQPVDVTVLGREDEASALLRGDGVGGRWLRAVDGLLALPPRIVIAERALLDGASGSRVLSHEITHRFVDSCFHDPPTWLQEGLATLFETTFVENGRVIVGLARYRVSDGAFAWNDSLYGLDVRTVPRLFVPRPTVLASMSDDYFYDLDRPHPDVGAGALGRGSVRDGAYAGAATLVHYLALGPDRDVRARFVWYLSALSQGTVPPDAAFAEAFRGVDLDERVEVYARADHYRVTARPMASFSETPPETSAMTSAEAHLRLSELELSVGGRGADTASRGHLALAVRSPSTRAHALLVAASWSEARAVELVMAAERIAPDDRDVLRARILVAQREGQREVATERASRLAARSDLRTTDLAIISEVERADGRLDAALAHAQRAVSTDRGAWNAWLALAHVARDRQDVRLERGALSIVASLAVHASPNAVREARASIASIDGVPMAPHADEGRAFVAPSAPASYEDIGAEPY